MKLKKILVVSFIIYSIVSIMNIRSIIARAATDSPNFLVLPILPKDSATSYFDLVMSPNEKRIIKFNISNDSEKEITVNTTFGFAFTGSTGTVDYTPNTVKVDSTLKYNLKNYVSLPAPATIAAHSCVTVEAVIKMPNNKFDGVVAGGFNFKENSKDNTKSSSKNGLTINNEYRYVVGLIIQQNKNIVKPELSLHDVNASQQSNRNIISANLKNSAMSYLLDMNVTASVENVSNPSIKYTFNNFKMKMAPNSNFDLAIPASTMNGNGQYSSPLKAGKYVLNMTVYGQENSNGTYATKLDGKDIKYLYSWKFKKFFNITSSTASTLNKKDVTVGQSSGINWIMIIGITIIFTLAILTLVISRNKLKGRQKK